MKREAIYHADTNELEELPQMKAPLMPHIMDYDSSDDYHDAMSGYAREATVYIEHVTALRRLPCSPQPGFKDREIYVENEHYEVKDAGEWKWCAQLKGNYFAVPIVPLWTDKLVLQFAEEYRFSSSRISIEIFKNSLTKR